MKKFKVLICCGLLVGLVGCGDPDKIVDTIADGVENIADEVQNVAVEQKETIEILDSDDKHIAYMKNYVGKNCASIGYTSMGGDRNDYLGEGYIELVFVTPRGEYIDIETDDQLKEYVVVAQDIAPNTQVNYTFDVDSDGEEFGFPEWQSVDQVVLQVKKVKENFKFENELTQITIPSDHYHDYIEDYRGRNLMNVGYISMAGDLRDTVSHGNIKLVVVAEDGAYIDFEDEELLKQYVVYDQSVQPNTEVILEYELREDGTEYTGWADYMSITEMDIYVRRVE